MFANLAAKVCQIVRNGKGREKQSAPRCVRSCEMVKGENKAIEKKNFKKIVSLPLWEGIRGWPTGHPAGWVDLNPFN